MFNQKINHFLSQNPEYLNKSMGAPYIRATDVHNCGTPILKYNKIEKCGSLPLQSWCSPHVAVESFAMRPIVNSKEYFENIKKYLANIIFTDSIDLKRSNLKAERYKVTDSFAVEPSNSFIQAIELNVTNRLIYLMGDASDKIDMFKNYNPLCEGFVINDIDIQTYQSTSNPNHFFHRVIFGAVNTTRYNTISFQAEIYQDTLPMMEKWNNVISKVENSQDISLNDGRNTGTNIYIAFIDLLNNTSCVLGQESECEFKGHNLSNVNTTPVFNNVINQNNFQEVKEVSWLNYPGLGDTTYNQNGDYDSNGNLRIIDKGPADFDSLLQSFM
jgi:hypothetical protein